MTPNRKNLLSGILIGLFLALAIFYFRSTISEQAPPFLIGFLTCLALVTCIFVIAGIWFKDQIFERFLGRTSEGSEPKDAVEKTVKSIAHRYVPEATDQDVKSGVRLIQNFLWGRAVYTFLGVLVSVFLVMGGLIGSVLIFKQNQLTAHQTKLINDQNTLLGNQNDKIEQQNELFDEQNKAVVAQTDLLRSQDTLFRAQNKFIKQQTELFDSQLIQIHKQNGLFRRQIDQTETEIGLLRSQDSLFRSQNEMFKKQLTHIEEQNSLLLRQDTLTQVQVAQVEVQNELLQNQIYLSEAERRSSLNFLLGSLLDQINRELKGINPFDRSLSNETIGRIAGISHSFKPYNYLQGDTLITKPLSPERGQLLIALLYSNLSHKTYDKIFESSNFSSSELQGSNLSGRYLSGVDLHNANLSGANLSGTDLFDANLIDADFSPDGASVVISFSEQGLNCNLLRKNSDYYKLDPDANTTNLNCANLAFADLSKANLYHADLNSADLSHSNLKSTNLADANLINANFTNANFDGTNFIDTNFNSIYDHQIKNIPTILKQLKQVGSLYECENLDPEIEAKLRSEKNCLFTLEGCKE